MALQDIQSWLAALGLEKFAPAFADAEIEYGDLEYLSDDDLKELGLPMGPRRRLSAAIKSITDKTVPSESPVNVAPTQPQTESVQQSDAERRQITVMFCDLVGSTALSEKLDPEDLRALMQDYQKAAGGVIERYGGHVAQYLGDGLMTYFGWPQAHEDDAERAVRASLDILKAVAVLDLHVRIGVATGTVVVGETGAGDASVPKLAVGETPNLAARLQGLAGADEIVVGPSTRRLLGRTFDVMDLGEQALKGIAGPVDAYRVEGEATVQSRFAARQSGSMTPIVGREREIELMIERWALARSGRGQMVIVSGEAGIGKSRITQAVIDEVANDDHNRLTYQCSPYHADSAFYPVIQQMSFAAGFASSIDVGTRLDKLEALLGDDQDTLRLVAPLLGLDGEARYGTLDLTPAQQRAKTMQALAGLLVQQATEKPALMVFEDLHWIDPTSQELLDILLDQITDQPIMILATARPTYEYGFGGHPIVTKFALNRLGKDQIASIVSKLTDGKTLPDEIMTIVAQRTDGVPLFVEELTKTILESGALKESEERYILDGPLSAIAIPTTLHDSLMARLDRLNPIKEVAQTAACIGREFSHGLLSQISPLPDAELSEALDGLIAAELIYRRGLPPEATYLFKHALVRDAAYESLLKEKRRAVHTRILSALKADADIAPEVLATHAEAAHLTNRAIDLWEAAGKAAIARPAFDEAISHFSHAIALLAPEVDRDVREAIERAVSLQTQLSYMSMSRFGWGSDTTKSALLQALAFADRVGETPLRFQILYGLMTTRYLRGDNVEAVHHGQVFVDLAEKVTETAPAVVANRSFAISLMFNGQFNRAQPYFDRALSLFDPVLHKNLAQKYGQDLGVASHGLICLNDGFLGETRRGVKLIRECECYAEACEDITSMCYMHMVAAFFHLLLQDIAEFGRHTKNLNDLADQYSLSLFRNVAAMFQSLLKLGSGDRTGFAELVEVDASLVAANSLGTLSIIRTEAGHRALATGLKDEALQLAHSAQDLINQTGEECYLSDLHRLQAAIAMADDGIEAAEKKLVTALNVARQQGAKLWELRATIDLASLWRDQGKTAEATSLLQTVHDSIAEGDCPEDRAKARELLSALAG